MKKTIKTYIVDSFTNEAFKGNPAGVCLLESELDERTMLSIAKELGFSETAFVLLNESADRYKIRYFSPKMEIPLCGHATMAASKVLFDLDRNSSLTFETIETKTLPIHLKGDLIEMEFPVYNLVKINASNALMNALGISQCINSEYNSETKILLLEISSTDTLKNLIPDFQKLLASPDTINGVLVTAKSEDQKYDFYSRYFWPWSGTNEDPVTGGTHTFLAKYWSDKLSKRILQSFQCSERSGFMEVELSDHNTVFIRGKAISVLEGQLNI